MPDGWLKIRRVPDDPETMRPVVTAAEWEAASAMKPASRRNEWLAWRAIVRERLGDQITITYDPNGAPTLDKGEGFLSVSHTKGWVAVVWSPERCAVDMELESRDVSRTAGRFISDEERSLSDSGNTLFPTAVWCAKEALYKYAGIPGLDFLDDLRITSSDISSERMYGTIKDGESVEIELLFRDGLVIAVIS